MRQRAPIFFRRRAVQDGQRLAVDSRGADAGGRATRILARIELRLQCLLGIERVNAYSGSRACDSGRPISRPRARSRRAPDRLCSSCRRCARRAKARCTSGIYRWTPQTHSGPRRRACRAVLQPEDLHIALNEGFRVLYAVFRVDRSPSLSSDGRLDILELLRDALRGLRRPKAARHSPKRGH
jgi:hypothetical protein